MKTEIDKRQGLACLTHLAIPSLDGNAYLYWLQNPETSNLFSGEPIVVFQAISMRVKLNMLDNRRLCAGGALS